MVNRLLSLTCLFCLALVGLAGCESRRVSPDDPPAIMAEDGSLAVRILLPDPMGEGLLMAAGDLVDAFGRVTGATPPANLTDVILHDPTDAAGTPLVNVLVIPEADDKLGDQGYWLDFGRMAGGSPALTVTARNETAAMYGIYRIIGDMGVRYYHPEDSFFPSRAEATLPWNYPKVVHEPQFDLRGFHEHTQHPIPASDFILRPESENARQYASNYLKWLVRNRQNVFTFHMLKTVDLHTWIPYITDIVSEAHAYGIQVGLLVGFVDQQQNAFRLIREDDLDPTSGDIKPAELQISGRLDELLVAGFDIVGLQIGSSEFTKPDDKDVVGWMNSTVEHLRTNHPAVRAYAWVHITCDLESDEGGHFFHLPLEADIDLGAYVHTTMFYTLEHPAPAYGCKDFGHQMDFLATATEQRRRQVFFPETAWWLGFDVNLPLALPLTGWSRDWDIRQVLSRYRLEPSEENGEEGYEIAGHATFTTGREWAYWQYDHFLTRITWDLDVTWDGYLEWIAPMYGENGDGATAALKDWTRLQKVHFYDTNPLIYLYLAGELAQDEAGFLAGIVSRQVRPAFRDVFKMSPDDFAGWKKTDYDLLGTMLPEYQVVFDQLPGSLENGTEHQGILYDELSDVLYVYLRRIEHALALYGGVIAAREGDEDAAGDHLGEARAISAEMKLLFEAAESRYRYPPEMVARSKEASLTAYKFGYLSETSTAYFWTRRDDQLAVLLADVFGTVTEAWTNPPDTAFTADSSGVTLVEPDDPMSAGFLPPFIPTMLFGSLGLEGPSPSLVMAQDYNQSGLPDPGTEIRVDAHETPIGWEGSAGVYSLSVRDVTGKNLGAMTVVDPVVSLAANEEEAALQGGFSTDDLVDLIVAITEGGIDEEGITNIIKDVFEVPPADPLPATLPIHFTFILEKI